MSKPPKPAEPSVADTPPKKSKKMLIVIIGALVLLLGGGAAAFLLMSPAHPPKHGEEAAEKHSAEVKSTYVELGTFTANLVREDGDRYLQVDISLEITKPELDEKIKAAKPAILHRVNMLLRSKRPSELSTAEGADKLANELKAQIEYVLGIRKVAPAITAATIDPAGAEAASQPVASHELSASQPAEAHEADTGHENRGGLASVLFTRIIVQ